jgi:hypothetical protein
MAKQTESIVVSQRFNPRFNSTKPKDDTDNPEFVGERLRAARTRRCP